MSKLITVPTFTFEQGDVYSDAEHERPIHVDFYNGCICLRQKGEFDQDEEIKIHPQFLNALFKEIKRHKPDAELVLNKK